MAARRQCLRGVPSSSLDWIYGALRVTVDGFDDDNDGLGWARLN